MIDSQADLSKATKNLNVASPMPTTPGEIGEKRKVLSTGYSPGKDARTFSRTSDIIAETLAKVAIIRDTSVLPPTPYAINKSMYKLPDFSNWDEAKLWISTHLKLNEEAMNTITTMVGSLKCIIFFHDALEDQTESANEMQGMLMTGLRHMFGKDQISYEPKESFNNPRMIVAFNTDLLNLFLDAFISISNDLRIYVNREAQVVINKRITLNLVLFDATINPEHGFKISDVSGATFIKSAPDICFNIKGLPTFYKARHLIPQFIEQQIPGIEVCKRNGSIVFNKAKMTHLKDLDETAFVPDHEDEDELMEAAGCQVYVTRESFFRTLTNVYVKKTMELPEFITFGNNNNTAPYICPYTFQQLDDYPLDNGKQVLMICGACKRLNCHYKDDKCPLNVVKSNHEVARYAEQKKRKQEQHLEKVAKAKKTKAWFASKSKNRFAE